MRVGYVSTRSGETYDSEQRILLTQAGCCVIYEEGTVDVRSRDRSAYAVALGHLRRGDAFVVCSLDRLARSMPEAVRRLAELHARGIVFCSLAEAIDTEDPSAPLATRTLQLLADLDQVLVGDKARAALVAAQRRGTRIGRRPALSEPHIAEARRLLEQGESPASVAVRFGVARCTLYRALSRSLGEQLNGNHEQFDGLANKADRRSTQRNKAESGLRS